MLIFTVLISLLLTTCQAASNIRGVRNKDLHLFQGPNFRCLDGSNQIPIEYVNDDYCDCTDGSDEPGTNACSNSKFWCSNKGAKPMFIYSSRVNDGVCDCCDGSDEYSSGACRDECAQVGEAQLAGLRNQIETAQQGLQIKNEWIKQNTITHQERKDQLEKLEAKLVIRKEEAEQARILKEQEEKLEAEENERRRAEAQANQPQETPSTPQDPAGQQQAQGQVNGEAPASPSSETQPETHQAEASPSAPNAVVESEVAAFPYPAEYAYVPPTENNNNDNKNDPAIGESGSAFPYPAEYAPKLEDNNGNNNNDDLSVDEDLPNPPEEEPPVYSNPVPKVDEYVSPGPQTVNHFSPDTPSKSFLENIYSWFSFGSKSVVDDNDDDILFKKKKPSFWCSLVSFIVTCDEPDTNEKSKKNSNSITPQPLPKPFLSAGYESPSANAARDAFSDANSKVSAIEESISEIKEIMDSDFGPDLVFADFYQKCFSVQVKQYTYEMCPYGDAKQKEGHSSTNLGSWAGLSNTTVDGKLVKTFLFTGGQTCWQGPARSLTVHLSCGVENKAIAVDEPSKCVYNLQFQTPAVCTEELIQDLNQKLAKATSEDQED